MGQVEQNIIAQALRFNQPIPERIRNKPELLEGLDVYFQAFLDLASDRVNEVIPWSSIIEYSRFYNFDFEQTEDLVFFVRGMDTEYSKYLTRKNKRK